MKLSNEELNELRNYRNSPEQDDIRYKQIVKEKLISNNKIIYLLHNEELEASDAEPDEYLNVSILPYYIVPGTQTKVKNYICFETSYDYVSRNNSLIKYQELIFYVLCHFKDINVAEVSVARHDLIAAELIDMFNGYNDFGTQMKLVSNKPNVVDNDYPSRTLIFENQTPIIKNGKIAGLRSGT